MEDELLEKETKAEDIKPKHSNLKSKEKIKQEGIKHSYYG
jgi:hypothetical protein